MDSSGGFSALFPQIPESLLLKVNGNATEDAFHFIGGEIAKGIRGALPESCPLARARHILDFGCGLGRVSSRLLQDAPEAQVVGFDIDPAMLHWSRRLLPDPRIRFVSSTLPLAAGGFDLITVVSVFTHLDETTDFWLSEINRLLANDGVAFITYQDETLFAELKATGAFPASAECADRFVTGQGGPEGGAAMGTFYATPYWQTLLARYFEEVTVQPRGLFGHQSISVVRRSRAGTFDRERLARQYAASLEGEIFALRRDHGIGY